MIVTSHNLDFLEKFLDDIGARYMNLVDDQVGMGIPQAYCSYLMSTGREDPVVLIDGGNTFNPYVVSRYSELFSVDEREVMSNIHVSRAFTCHQFSTLVNSRLESEIVELGSRTVVLSEPASLYIDRAAEEEVLEGFRKVHQRLLEFTYSMNLTTVIVHSYRIPRPVDGGALERGRRERAAKFTERVLWRLADSVYRVEERPKGCLVSRLKNPYYPEGPAFLIPFETRLVTLADFMEGPAQEADSTWA